MAKRPPLRVGIAGIGAIGFDLAQRLDSGVPGLVLAAATAGDADKASRRLADLASPPRVGQISEMVDLADAVVECAPSGAFLDIAEPVLEAGRILVPASVGQLLQHPHLPDLAAARGGRIVVPTGALLGLDAVRAAAEGDLRSVRLITRKPPTGLAGAPHLRDNAIDVSDLNAPLKVFEGSARDGIVGFPANVNVAVALSLAGLGPDRTSLEIWADPTVTRNTHQIDVESDSARFTMTIENVPTEENPRTGRITALSILACIKGLVSPLKIGS
jgi:aspartate dehydrogenase